MHTILVTGGTGHLGRDLVKQLTAQRRPVRALARTPGRDPGVEWVQGDLATGAGLAEAVAGVQTVIHAATLSPIARRGSMRLIDLFRSPSTVDVDGTRRLLQVAERAAVEHFVHVSIVGLEHGSGLPYMRIKLAGEDLVRQSALPWSVVRATPFYYLVERTLAGLWWLPIWPLPDMPFQPVDTPDVATYLIECLDDGQRGVREEIAGPQVLSFIEIARQYQQARGLHRPIVRTPLPKAILRNLRATGITEAQGRRGAKTWASWLGEHPSGDARLRAGADRSH
jgi:uncharacterized protein YbjT (DUF2867 family)